MSVVGKWNVALETPFGEQVVTLEFRDERTGTGRYGSESIPLGDVTSAGDNATWTVVLAQPIKITLKCAVVTDGDTMSGTARAGFFGTFRLSGRRVAS